MEHPRTRTKRKLYFGMTGKQVGILAVMGALLCIVLGFGMALVLNISSPILEVPIQPSLPAVASVKRPTYTPLPAPVSHGLGVSTSLVKATMGDRGYVFENPIPVSGYERWMGKLSNGTGLVATVDLLGSPEIVRAQYTTILLDDDLPLMRQVGADAGVLIRILLPNWSDASQWITASVRDATSTGKEGNTSYNGIPIQVKRFGAESYGYFLSITIGDIP